jgi:hypothetical protein
MIARSRVSALSGSGGGVGFASGESKVSVRSACENCVSDFDPVVSVICDQAIDVSCSSVATRKARPGRESSFADGNEEFVCPNEFTHPATSRQKDILFIIRLRFVSLRPEPKPPNRGGLIRQTFCSLCRSRIRAELLG